MQKHKILAFLLALIVTIGLWVYAVTVVNPDGTTKLYDVRVRIDGTNMLLANNLILTGGENQTVDVEIAGRRSDLKELSSSSVEAIADVKYIDRAGTYELSWQLGLPATVASGDVRIVGASSNRVKVTISDYLQRSAIPVEVEYLNKLSDDYVLGEDGYTLDRETVSVSGPAEEVGRIARALVTVDLNGATTSINEDMEYRLVDENGEELELSEYVQIDDPTVFVHVPIRSYKKINLEVKLIPGAGATKDNVEMTIEPAAIGVTSNSAELLKDLNEYVIEIDLAEVTDDSQQLEVPIVLPAGVEFHGSDGTAKITIAFTGLTTKDFEILCEDFVRENDDSKTEALVFGATSVTITLRGTEEALNAISEEDIEVYADMDTFDSDNMKVTLRIRILKNTTVGVIGTYTVHVTG